MNLLIIYTHPNHTSLNYSFMEKVLLGISNNPKEVETKILDLYSEGFNPSLYFDQIKKRRDMSTDIDLETYRNMLTWANHIVFIYPIWWGRPPAMLLGFFDRVLATGFAYQHKKGFITEGLLTNKTVTCISTMKGPTHYPRLFLNNVHQVLMKKAVLNFVGIKKIKFFEFGSSETKKGKQERQLYKVQNYFEYL